MTEITSKSDLDSLTTLGREAGPGRNLETFPNHHPGRDYTVTLSTSEFTCLCPLTGQPDFARITIKYIPYRLIVESKSLKLYLASFRNEGAFHEHVTNVILDDLVKAVAPRWCKVSAEFAVRGGVAITVDAEFRAPAPEQEKRKGAFGERIHAEGEGIKPPSFRRTGGKERGRPPQGEVWADRRKRRPEEGKAWSERENRRPPKEGERPPVKPGSSVRKTTKSPGETRTWRKRI